MQTNILKEDAGKWLEMNKEGRKGLKKRHRKAFWGEVYDDFLNLVDIHRCIHYINQQFVVCKFYLNRTVKQ